MGWLRVPHRCAMPSISTHGDIWRCDECKKTWRYAYGRWYRLNPLGQAIYLWGR